MAEPLTSWILEWGIYPAMALALSLLMGWLVLHTEDLHHSWTADHPEDGPQKVHSVSTVRIGGVAIFVGLVGAVACANWFAFPALQTSLQAMHLEWLFFGLSLLFCLGFIEDISGAVSVRLRLILSLVAGGLVWFYAGVRVTHASLPLLDDLLKIAPISLCFTMFALGGLVHAMNIVDGANGLLGGIGVLVMGAIAWVAGTAGAQGLLLIALCTGAAALGFLAYNFPHARMFCGDAGAYLLGFVAAVLLILLMNQHIASPWFGLAVVIHPVTETLYSAWRRAKNGSHAMLPDTKHMHSLWVNHLREVNHPVRLGFNAGAAWRTLAMAAVPIVLAAAMPLNKWALQAICLVYVLVFVCAVRRLEKRIEERDSMLISQSPFAENCK